MCSWDFSQLFKEGSWAVRGKVCLWVMFLLLPIAILEIYRKKAGGEESKTWGFNPASLMSPGALPFTSAEALINAFHFFSLLLALQSKLLCALALLGGVSNSTSRSWTGTFHLWVSYKLTSYFISEPGHSVRPLDWSSLCIPDLI